ncbi:MAG: diphthine synthase [Nitrososphaeraceae archaeon]
MLTFIGFGIYGYKGITIEIIETLKKCDVIYVERFTSFIHDTDIEKIKELTNSKKEKVKIAPRWLIEDGKEILNKSANNDVVILTYGDPFIATTLHELYVRAKKKSINIKTIHGVSGIYSSIGEIGLHNYKFGRTTTIMSEPQSAISVYNTVFDNLQAGNHSLILTEYNQHEDEIFYLNPQKIFKMLLDVEKEIRYNVFDNETYIIVASRIGCKDQKIVSGKIDSLTKITFGNGPHCIIIPGFLHFTEIDALTTLYKNMDNPTDNCKKIRNISVNMLERYIPKAKQAVQQLRYLLNNQQKEMLNDKRDNKNVKNKGMNEVIDNAEYYIIDAERFFRQNKLELAVLSIGYAEGLIDAIRFQKNINPWT